jgi:citrate synthase
MTREWKGGLEDVVATRSAICRVDGEGGRLFYRGYEVGELAGHVPFEAVTWLLWFGELPTADEAAMFSADLGAAWDVPRPVLNVLDRLPVTCHPLDALRTAVSAAAAWDPDLGAGGPEASRRRAVRLTALVPAAVAAWHRRRSGRTPLAPRPGLGHAAQFLFQLTGEEPSPGAARTLDALLTLHAEHELNASTFALRVAVATLADLYAAVVAAVATLKGPRHGGANEDVLAMLHEIGDPERAEGFIAARLERRRTLSRAERAAPEARVPGFGHRVYRVDDPRAGVLRTLAHDLARATGRQRRLEVAERVYAAVKARTELPVNVDFFSAVVYDALGIAPDLCTSVFAVARVAGWCAHALEQAADNRLIRPRAEYVGPAPRRLAPLRPAAS